MVVWLALTADASTHRRPTVTQIKSYILVAIYHARISMLASQAHTLSSFATSIVVKIVKLDATTYLIFLMTLWLSDTLSSMLSAAAGLGVALSGIVL